MSPGNILLVQVYHHQVHANSEPGAGSDKIKIQTETQIKYKYCHCILKKQIQKCKKLYINIVEYIQEYIITNFKGILT